MYDLIIVGAGPAGLTASIYASRYKLKHLVLAKSIGGTVLEAHKVENYPGFSSITGMDLMQKFSQQVKDLGAEIKMVEVDSIKKKDKIFEVIDSENKKYQAKAIILALGTRRRQLNIPGEKEFLGKGVSYCAVCDAAFCKDKIVAVVGGSNAAVTSALMLAEHAQKVYLIYRKDELRAEPIVVERLKTNSKIEIITDTNILKIEGKDKVEKIILDKDYKDSKELKLDYVFIEVGSVPLVALASKLGVEVDKTSFIKIGPDQATNVLGVYAAGDVTAGLAKLRQIVTAAAEGAVAATSAYKYLRTK